MEVVLTKDTPKLGEKHMIVKVRPGYFRNYLMPKGLAMLVTEPRRKQAEKMREKTIKLKKVLGEKAQEVKKQLEGVILTFKKKATSKNKLYGSIGEKDIVEALAKEAKMEIGPENVIMQEHLKALGEYEVELKLADDVITKVKVVIEAVK